MQKAYSRFGLPQHRDIIERMRQRDPLDTAANPLNLGCGIVIMAALTAGCFWLHSATNYSNDFIAQAAWLAGWGLLIITAIGTIIGIAAMIFARAELSRRNRE